MRRGCRKWKSGATWPVGPATRDLRGLVGSASLWKGEKTQQMGGLTAAALRGSPLRRDQSRAGRSQLWADGARTSQVAFSLFPFSGETFSRSPTQFHLTRAIKGGLGPGGSKGTGDEWSLLRATRSPVHRPWFSLGETLSQLTPHTPECLSQGSGCCAPRTCSRDKH